MKILHIDDNQEITKVFEKILFLKHHDYLAINDGRQGLEQILKEDYDIIILDLSMPNFSGFQVLEELENKGVNCNNIIVMTAASLTDKEKLSLVNFGIKTILPKPVTLKKMLDILNDNRTEERIITVE